MTKQRQQTLAVAVALVVFVLVLVGAAQLSKRRPTMGTRQFFGRSGVAPDRPRLRLTRRSSSGEPAKAEDSGSEDAEGAEAAGDRREDAPATPGQQAVQEALNALSPEQGIERLLAFLAAHEQSPDASQLYATLGTLYGQTNPPNTAEAEAAFAKAVALARSPEDRHGAAYAQAMALQRQDSPEQALAVIEDALSSAPSTTLAGLQLGVMQARLYERSGQADAAEEAYKNNAESALAASETLGPETLDIYRQACLSLARFYRKTGRPDKADEVARNVKRQLNR